MKYYVIVQATAFPLSAEEFSVDSAFAGHLLQLREQLGSRFEVLVLVGPAMSAESYKGTRASMTVLDARTTGIRFLPAFAADVSRIRFLLTGWLPMWRWLNRLFDKPCVVHAGMSTDLARPLMFMAALAGRHRKRPVIFMVDMDFRQHARRFRQTGIWNTRQYLVNRCLYDPQKWLQLWLAPRLFDLCCFKGGALVRDFGGGRPNVRTFFDTAHAPQDVLDGPQLALRVAFQLDTSNPLMVTYFGRLAPNKGIDRMVSAVHAARAQGSGIRMRIIGAGECGAALQEQIHDLQLQDAVEIVPPAPYGPALFDLLQSCHLCLAAPLVEDTPRAAFDAMARGLPLVAFDISYFTDLAQLSQAVLTTPWPRVEGLAAALSRLAADREQLANLTTNAVNFARENTQDIWLARRLEWTDEVLKLQPVR